MPELKKIKAPLFSKLVISRNEIKIKLIIKKQESMNSFSFFRLLVAICNLILCAYFLFCFNLVEQPIEIREPRSLDSFLCSSFCFFSRIFSVSIFQTLSLNLYFSLNFFVVIVYNYLNYTIYIN